MNWMIEADKVSYDYAVFDEDGNETGSVRAVNRVDLLVEKGEFVAVLGHNGSGKSTFAREINALFLPSEGTLKVNGMDTKDEELLWEVRRDAGMVFQNPDNQIIASIVEEDVAFGPENLGFEPAKIRENVDAGLAAVNMEDHRKDSPNKLSGGQKQRIAIAGILAMEPDCIILDEPTAMLDPSGRREVMETIRYLNREKKITIVYITHHMDEARQADRIVVMDHGSVVMSGKPRESFTRVEEMKSLGLDVPQAAELAWRLRKRGIMVRPDVMTMEELKEELCRLKSNI